MCSTSSSSPWSTSLSRLPCLLLPTRLLLLRLQLRDEKRLTANLRVLLVLLVPQVVVLRALVLRVLVLRVLLLLVLRRLLLLLLVLPRAGLRRRLLARPGQRGKQLP